jgi:hypothetical protein
MRALVVYESMYGNTRRVAEAIAEGLRQHVEAEVVEVGLAPTTLPAQVQLIVVGGPTHAHGVSKPSTRANAAERVARPVVSTGQGVREWIAAVEPATAIAAAAFDTRINGPTFITGSAAKGLEKDLAKRGFRPLLGRASFVLAKATGGPYDQMNESELDRARTWGRELAERVPAIAVP